MNLGLPLSSGCDETHQVALRLSVKEEEYGHMITCQDVEEKPIADLHCKTVTDLSESLSSTYNEILQTTVEVEGKKGEDEQEHQDSDSPQESVSEHPDIPQQKKHGQQKNNDLNQLLNRSPHHCTVCGKSFGLQRNFKRHQKTHSPTDHQEQHTGEKPHKCAQCGLAFGSTSHLHRHMVGHTGEKPHKCTQCGKAFSQNSNLKIHMLIHTGEKPYKCSYCEKAFNQATSLKVHKRSHTGEKPYACEHCGKAYTSFHNLKYHQRLHSEQNPKYKVLVYGIY